MLYLKYAACIIISIHLMLMLIKNRLEREQENSYISIHLMLMLIGYSKQKNHIEQHFNTSHVNVNLCIFRSLNVVFKISIHLMLMLIRFNFLYFCSYFLISIHLMLMLISQVVIWRKMAEIFQYISC